jgi:two-component system, OmpR family, response regulator VicR
MMKSNSGGQMSKGKILIIDDNPVIVRMAEALLLSAGYQVCLANTGPQGIDLAQKENPDLILLDIILPDIHGFEVFKALRQQEVTRHIPIVYMTATELEDIALNEPDVKGEGYINKPFGNKELLEAVEKVLGGQIKDH